VDEASPQSRVAYLLGVAETLRGIAGQLRYDLRAARIRGRPSVGASWSGMDGKLTRG